MREGWESACKPGSVEDNHSSGMYVAIHLLRPTREQCEQHYSPLIWPCSRRGLPCRACCQSRGALLPHHFTLTRLLSLARRYVFCCTCRRLAPPRSYLAPCPVEPGLSSVAARLLRETLTQAVTAAIARPTPTRILIQNKAIRYLRVPKYSSRWRGGVSGFVLISLSLVLLIPPLARLLPLKEREICFSLFPCSRVGTRNGQHNVCIPSQERGNERSVSPCSHAPAWEQETVSVMYAFPRRSVGTRNGQRNVCIPTQERGNERLLYDYHAGLRLSAH